MQNQSTTDEVQKEIPYGYCHCGCGRKTKLSTGTNRNRGLVKGVPLRFVQGHNHKSRPLADAFWDHLTPGAFDQCWLWQGRVNRGGYGELHSRGHKNRPLRAHRISWELHFGSIPEGMFVCHNCPNVHNRLCCNPYHLYLGTALDNNRDTIRQGNGPLGERNASAKLSEMHVVEIRKLYAGGMKPKQLGERFGVSRDQVERIVRGKCWKHLP